MFVLVAKQYYLFFLISKTLSKSSIKCFDISLVMGTTEKWRQLKTVGAILLIII